MRLTYQAHSCFLLESDAGTRILTDPCDPGTGYRIGPLAVDAVTVSHDHFDHGYTAAASGNPHILRTEGSERIGDVSVLSIPCFHDEVRGAKRGENLAFRFTADGVTLLHLGDLGHLPDDAFLRAAGSVDVLLCPVGGTFTLDAAAAAETVALLSPKLVVPMHYATPHLSFSIAGPEAFLKQLTGYAVQRGGTSCALSGALLSGYTALLLQPAAPPEKM